MTETILPQMSDRTSWPIIIGGCYRSGTSLLRRLLNSHSRIHCGPEVTFFRDFYGDYRHDPLKHLRFFTTIRHLEIEEERLLNLFGSVFLEAHIIAAQKQKKARWADKNPENVLYMRQWSFILKGQFYFVHCVRHPLDTLASLKEANFSLTVPQPYSEKIQVYRTFVEAGIAFEEIYPSQSFRLRYEDLVQSPRIWLNKLMNFTGEEFEEGILDFQTKKHQAGLEDPKIESSERIHEDSVGRGYKTLMDSEINLALKRCADLFDQLGYEFPR